MVWPCSRCTSPKERARKFNLSHLAAALVHARRGEPILTIGGPTRDAFRDSAPSAHFPQSARAALPSLFCQRCSRHYARRDVDRKISSGARPPGYTPERIDDAALALVILPGQADGPDVRAGRTIDGEIIERLWGGELPYYPCRSTARRQVTWWALLELAHGGHA